jgi:hypothetical protein
MVGLISESSSSDSSGCICSSSASSCRTCCSTTGWATGVGGGWWSYAASSLCVLSTISGSGNSVQTGCDLSSKDTLSSTIDGASSRAMEARTCSSCFWSSEWCSGSGCHADPRPRMALDVTESDRLLKPTRESVFHIEDMLVLSVDWPFFNVWTSPDTHFCFHKLPLYRMH